LDRNGVTALPDLKRGGELLPGINILLLPDHSAAGSKWSPAAGK
jgi:hypothetical protein